MNTYKILNKTLGAVALSILFSTNAIAQKQAAKDMKVLNKEIKKKGNKVNVYMDLNLDDVKLASNKGLIFTPILYKGEDTLKLPAVEVMGNKRYIYYQRTKKTATQNPLIVAVLIKLADFRIGRIGNSIADKAVNDFVNLVLPFLHILHNNRFIIVQHLYFVLFLRFGRA